MFSTKGYENEENNVIDNEQSIDFDVSSKYSLCCCRSESALNSSEYGSGRWVSKLL